MKKVLYLMRDPVERMWSHLKMHRKSFASHGGDGDISIDELIKLVLLGRQNHILTRSNYTGTLYALNHLPKDRVKYMFYETLFSDDAMLTLCNFMGVNWHPGNYGLRVRGGEDAEMTKEQRAILMWLTAPVYRAVYKKFGNAVPAPWNLDAMHAKRPSFLDETTINPNVLKKAG